MIFIFLLLAGCLFFFLLKPPGLPTRNAPTRISSRIKSRLPMPGIAGEKGLLIVRARNVRHDEYDSEANGNG